VKVFDLPSAIKERLILHSKNFDAEAISIRRYRKMKVNMFDFKDSPISLFYYQADALNRWKDNAYRLLFEMATGTGKTRTAIAGIARILAITKRVVVVVSTPQNTLSKQWKEEMEHLGVKWHRSEVIDGTVRGWSDHLSRMLLDNSTGFADHCVIFTTHNTASSDKFTTILQRDLHKETVAVLVGDEVDWRGSTAPGAAAPI
jgi:superfamily II DNA or RNA helicase